MFIDDTIAAIATAPGEGGIGIIRISGEKSLQVAQSIFKSKSGKMIKDYNARTLIYGTVVDNEKVIDEVLVAYMKGPNSYTAEDVIEINCHGGFISVKKILELIQYKDSLGKRMKLFFDKDIVASTFYGNIRFRLHILWGTV